MNRKKLWTMAAAGIAAGGGGCVTRHNYTALPIAMAVCHDREFPYPFPVRQKVHLFILNGADVLDLTGTTGLRDGVVEAGYPKVYFAQQIDLAWYEREVRRVGRDDPQSRVVLFGHGASAEEVLCLARGASADGAPVDAVVLLDPKEVKDPGGERGPYRVIVLKSKHWKGKCDLPGAEIVELDDVGTVAAPRSFPVLEAVVGVMTDSAGKVGPLDGDPIPTIPLRDTPNPTPRGEFPRIVDSVDDWDFLKLPPKPGVPAAPPDPPTGYVPRVPVPVSPQGPAPYGPLPGEPLPAPRTEPVGEALPPPQPGPEAAPPPRPKTLAPGAIAR